MKPIASISFAAVLLMLAPSLPAQAQANSAVAPSASGETKVASSGNETGNPAAAEAGRPGAHKAAHRRKKKSSFMRKMRDKAKQQVQKVEKLLGSKGAKPESKQE